ncbi:hypothetical protein Golob_002517 [Gossypium lobatum]|uniref:Uncharacterized protein n=1 Tax=Gossypium lobatum TaxID=34289 RepID=A0A7J8N578_9ROSI|nr:hypothetical protein [Gossypium lobatum]
MKIHEKQLGLLYVPITI